MGEAPPLIISVDLGGGQLVGAGDWGGWDGGRMGCDGMVGLLQKGEWGGVFGFEDGGTFGCCRWWWLG